MLIEGPFRLGDHGPGNPRQFYREISHETAWRAGAGAAPLHHHPQRNGGRAGGDAGCQGMLTVAQIAKQLLPHIENDEIPLDDTVVIEARSELISLLGADLSACH